MLLLHIGKLAAMKMKLASWIKKVDCEDLGSFESLSSFTHDGNKNFSSKINKNIDSLSFEVDCTCLSWTLRNEGFSLHFSSLQGLGKEVQTSLAALKGRGIGKENGLVGNWNYRLGSKRKMRLPHARQ